MDKIMGDRDPRPDMSRPQHPDDWEVQMFYHPELRTWVALAFYRQGSWYVVFYRDKEADAFAAMQKLFSAPIVLIRKRE